MRKKRNPARPPRSNEKGPLDTDPIQNSSNPTEAYSATVQLARELFPSWDPESLAYTVQWMIQEAQSAKPGAWVQAPVGVLPVLGVISLDFDGQGGILVNPETMCTAKGKELAKALRLVLGQMVRIGHWEAA